METQNSLDIRRIVIFLAFTFGIAWITTLVIYLTGGLTDSPELVPGLGITLAYVLMAFPMMWSPAIANVLTRLITREGWRDTLLRPVMTNGAWKYWLIAWLLPPLLIAVGAALYYVIYPQFFDPETRGMADLLSQQLGGEVAPSTVRLIIALQLGQGLLLAPIINGLFTFGEEFGWRAYLQPKMLPMGVRKALVLIGVIWGVWHWPVIFMGYEYGLDYAGFPVVGPLLFLLFTISLSIIEGWLTLRGGSVWPAVLAHAMINGFAAMASLFMAVGAAPNPLIGPLPIGLIPMLPLIAFAAGLLVHPTALAPAAVPADVPVEALSITTPA